MNSNNSKTPHLHKLLKLQKWKIIDLKCLLPYEMMNVIYLMDQILYQISKNTLSVSLKNLKH